MVYPEPELTLSPEIRGRGERGAERYNFRFREIERPFKFVGGFNLLFYLLLYIYYFMYGELRIDSYNSLSLRIPSLIVWSRDYILCSQPKRFCHDLVLMVFIL